MTGQSELVKNLTLAWAGDVQLLVDQYVADCRFEDKAFGIVHHGHEGLREVFDFSFAMMPDFSVEYGREILGPECGAVEWTFTGRFQGEHGGRKHTATPVRIEGVSFMTFRDGRIATNCDYWNVKPLEEQLSGEGASAA